MQSSASFLDLFTLMVRIFGILLLLVGTTAESDVLTLSQDHRGWLFVPVVRAAFTFGADAGVIGALGLLVVVIAVPADSVRSEGLA